MTPLSLQSRLNTSVALLLNEPAEVIPPANGAGFRCFTSVEEFRTYGGTEFLKLEAA